MKMNRCEKSHEGLCVIAGSMPCDGMMINCQMHSDHIEEVKKMIGWDGANMADNSDSCSVCWVIGGSDYVDVIYLHRIGGEGGPDHIAVCEGCIGKIDPEIWHGCGCGG